MKICLQFLKNIRMFVRHSMTVMSFIQISITQKIWRNWRKTARITDLDMISVNICQRFINSTVQHLTIWDLERRILIWHTQPTMMKKLASHMIIILWSIRNSRREWPLSRKVQMTVAFCIVRKHTIRQLIQLVPHSTSIFLKQNSLMNIIWFVLLQEHIYMEKIMWPVNSLLLDVHHLPILWNRWKSVMISWQQVVSITSSIMDICMSME